MQRVMPKVAKVAARVMPRARSEDEDNPDWCARRVIIHAFLYYVLDASIISDNAYDRLVRIAADNWDKLSPDRQWALRSPEDIRSTGSRIRYSSYAVAAALNFHKYNTGEIYDNYRSDQWRHRKADNVSYVTAGAGKPRRVG